MTALIVLLVGAVCVWIAWSWSVRSITAANEIALVAVLAALAASGRVLVGGIPSVEPVTIIVVCATIALGVRNGIAVGVLAVLLSNLALGHGPWSIWQMAAYVVVALIAAAGAPLASKKWVLGAVALCGAVAYDVILTVSQYILFANTPQGGDTSMSALIVLGIPLLVVHAVSTVAFAIIIGPTMLHVLERGARRFSVIITSAQSAP